MGEAVQQGPGEPFRTEDFGPLLKGQVGGHDETIALTGTADHVEQKFGTGFG